MKKTLAASKTLMKNYLSELLTEESESNKELKEETTALGTVEKSNLNKLLQQTNVVSEVKADQLDVITSTKSENKTIETTVESTKITEAEAPKESVKSAPTINKQIKKAAKEEKEYREGSFQAMFFEVAGLLVAVPLIELGGIHNAEKTNSLMGKPDWFKGVMLHREEKINIVDTALWVMPEKYNDALKESLDYQYVIMLNNSNWGLLAESLVDTVTLEQEDVKWIEGVGKRPWLAGLVKERMCALLDVDSLIQMLDQGANINQSTH